MIKGVLLAVSDTYSSSYICSSIPLSIPSVLGHLIRAVLLFSFLALVIWALYRWVIDPIWKLFTLNRHLSNEEAAAQIGHYFPTVKDKLLNTLQLYQLSSTDNALIQASISQKTGEISKVPFVNAISFTENKKYAKYLLLPLAILVVVLFAAPQLFTDSTPRIINFRKSYAAAAPFQFNLINEDLRAFKNEDFYYTAWFYWECNAQYRLSTNKRPSH